MAKLLWNRHKIKSRKLILWITLVIFLNNLDQAKSNLEIECFTFHLRKRNYEKYYFVSNGHLKSKKKNAYLNIKWLERIKGKIHVRLSSRQYHERKLASWSRKDNSKYNVFFEDHKSDIESTWQLVSTMKTFGNGIKA